MNESPEAPDPWVNEEKPFAADCVVPTAPLKTNYKDPAKRYSLAERIVWSKTPIWKRQVIIHCKFAVTTDRIFDEYAHEIVLLAESEATLDKADSLPPVPSYTLSSEPAAA